MGLINNRRNLRLFSGRNNQYFPWMGWLPKGFGVVCPTIFVKLVGKPTNPLLRDILVNHNFFVLGNSLHGNYFKFIQPPVSYFNRPLNANTWARCWSVVSYGHDDVIKWKHFPRNWPFVRGIHRSPGNSPHKGQWRGALMFSLTCVWINGWVNNLKVCDLRRYRAHCDVIVVNYLRHAYQSKYVHFGYYKTDISPTISFVFITVTS